MPRFTRSTLCFTLSALLTGCHSFAAGRGDYGQTYNRARHNWVFRRLYPQADRLFNGFDYGHATLYESLVRGTSADKLDGVVRGRVINDALRRAPSVPLEERAIGPQYGTLVPELVATFEWVHMLHRELYDVLSDKRIAPENRAAHVERLLAYYRSRPDLALSDRPKAMELMEGQPYSLVFRRMAPRYNALIWSYHWLQMVMYDALMSTECSAERRELVDAILAHFWYMVDTTTAAPSVMPMSAAIAPRFTSAYPEAAAVFDNLHALHDVLSDILASRTMTRSEQVAAARLASEHYRDSTTAVTSRDEWLAMSAAMGVENMGGTLPCPTSDSSRTRNCKPEH